MKVKFDWWLVSGLFFILVGVLSLLQTLGGQMDFWAIYGPVYVLSGIGLLKRVKKAFWVVLALALISFLQPVFIGILGGASAGFSMFDIISLIVLGILWFQMGKPKAAKAK